MTLILTSSDISFFGPALPETFVQQELERVLGKNLPSAKDADPAWSVLLKALREPLVNAGNIRVRNVILAPLMQKLGYDEIDNAEPVTTREGAEAGGLLLKNKKVNSRAWVTGYEEDLDAPTKRGLNARYSPLRIAERVLLTTGERMGLLTNGVELRLILSDPARRASYISFSLSQWKQLRHYDPLPDAFRLFAALAQPSGYKILPEVLEQARLKQGQVTKDLRLQARTAIEKFVQGVLDHPANQAQIAELYAARGREVLAKDLWGEALVMVYRLLFILRGESGGRETPPFSFASHSLWRNTYSPSRAQPGNLAWVAQQVREEGKHSGEFLEQGLRALFRAFALGLNATELHIAPLGGALFGKQATPLLDELHWGERGCAELLDNLLRAPRGKGKQRTLARLSYRDLDVEELGHVYEALLELEPGITSEPMVRLRRAKLEVVVPAAQGEKYRPKSEVELETLDDESEEEEDETEDEESETRKKSKIQWIEAIPPGRFYLRVGLGRKSSGGHYTPESFVRFLVLETLGPLCDRVSPEDDPQPSAILRLNVLDPAMGSAHFLIGADRFLGQRLHDACLHCAELKLWERIPEEIQPYMPGRRPEGESEAGFSAQRALALCKRLVAVHCLYGVDKNPLAVSLAKVALWLESFAEDLPLTFLDHRLICGDSLLGPMNLLGDGPDSPMTPPYATTPIDQYLAQDVRARLQEHLNVALNKVRELDATIGIDENDLRAKQQTKRELDAALKPFMDVCVAWSGGVMLGSENVDEAGYRAALERVARNEWLSEDEIRAALETLEKNVENVQADNELPFTPGFLRMLRKGREANVVVFPLAYPEVFFSTSDVSAMAGFDAVLGNPPWDKVRPKAKEFFATYDFNIVAAPTLRERASKEKELLKNPEIAIAHQRYISEFSEAHCIHDLLFKHQIAIVDGEHTGGDPDAAKLFMERFVQVSEDSGYVGIVVPSAFHANEGFTGIRKLYLTRTALKYCYSFENRRKLFEIHSSFKFAVTVARKDTKGTKEFSCGFYLQDDSWLFDRADAYTYSLDFVQRTGGDYWGFIEPSSVHDLNIISICTKNGLSFKRHVADRKIVLSRELDTTGDSWRFVPVKDVSSNLTEARRPENVQNLTQKGYLLFAEGKSFHQFDDLWGEPTRYLVPLDKLKDRPTLIEMAQYYRLTYRTISASTNERTAIFNLMTPGYTTGRSSPCDSGVKSHPNANSLELLAIANGFSFDFLLRLYVSSATLNYFFLARTPFPSLSKSHQIFFVHCALRLTCNHTGYAPLWNEQLGNEWREPKPQNTFPVLATDDERWDVRAAIDAVVAQAYGLSREQYAHVLASFSHKSYPKAPALCLAKFDELTEIGLDLFTKKYDPYWDVPLVETLPLPVIELPEIKTHTAAESGINYEVKNLFGEIVPTNLFGEVVEGKQKRGKRK